MEHEFKPGDEVEFDSNVSKGAKKSVVKGTVEAEITEPTKVDGHKVNATPDDPKYVIETKDGEEAHGGSAIRKQ